MRASEAGEGAKDGRVQVEVRTCSLVVRPPGLEPRNLQIKNLLLYR